MVVIRTKHCIKITRFLNTSQPFLLVLSSNHVSQNLIIMICSFLCTNQLFQCLIKIIVSMFKISGVSGILSVAGCFGTDSFNYSGVDIAVVVLMLVILIELVLSVFTWS